MNLLCFPGANLVKNTNLSHDSVFLIVHSFALYSSKFVGEFQLQLEGEQELVHFTVRTLKVGKLKKKKGWKVGKLKKRLESPTKVCPGSLASDQPEGDPAGLH